VFKPGQIDEQFDQIVLRAMQPDREDRYQSAAEMLAALNDAMGATGPGIPKRKKPIGARRRQLLVGTALIALLAVGAFVAERIYTAPKRNLVTLFERTDSAGIIESVKNNPRLNTIVLDDAGSTPLHRAAELNMMRVVDELLTHGADIDVQDHDKRTPLHRAALKNRPEIIGRLMERGAKDEIPDKDGLTAYELAKRENKPDAILVFENRDLITAIKDDNKVKIEELINRNLAKYATKQAGLTALHYAAWKGHMHATEQLLKNEAPVDAPSKATSEADLGCAAGTTPLMLACMFSGGTGEHAKVVEALLNGRADCNRVDATGRTALHYACQKGNKTIVESLLAQKADVNAQASDDHFTPTHSAIVNGSAAIVDLLIKQGADLGLRTDKGWDALQLAASEGRDPIVKVLRNQSGHVFPMSSRKSARQLAEENKHSEVVKSLDDWWRADLFASLEEGAGVKEVEPLLDWPHSPGLVRESDSRSLLGVAVSSQAPNLDTIKLLVDREPDSVDRPDSDQESPLFFAARVGNLGALRVLAPRAKDLNAVDERGLRLLNVAISGEKEGAAIGIVEYLVSERRCELDAADKGGVTPLQAAATRYDPKMVKNLLDLGATPEMTAFDAACGAIGVGPVETREILARAILRQMLETKTTTRADLTTALEKFQAQNIFLATEPLEPDGLLPLQIAIQNDCAGGFDLFTEELEPDGLNTVNEKTGDSALHTAARLGKQDYVIRLLKKGADYLKQNNAGQTPELAAREANELACATELEQHRKTQQKIRDDAIAAAQDHQKAAEEAKGRALDAAARASGAKEKTNPGDARVAVDEASKAVDEVRQALSRVDALAKEHPSLGPVVAAQKSATAAKTEAEAALARAELDLREAEIRNERRADAAVAYAWFKAHLKDKNHNLVIDGADKVDRGPYGQAKTLMSSKKQVEWDCDQNGILTITPEEGVIRGMGQGRIERRKRRSPDKVVGQEPETIYDRNLKRRVPTGRTVNVMRWDGTYVEYDVHVYSGPLARTAEQGVFEWRVGDQRFKVRVELR
jgi:ankyrin repeat protein